MNVRELATRAALEAARVRARFGVGPADALCPFDLADRIGLTVRLLALPSLEGMYASEPQATILVSSERPPGRRRYTCGHEIGHHVFSHGTGLDELFDDQAQSWSPKEFVAHRFAAGVLMPKLAVEAAFARRSWSASAASAQEVYIVAQDLGVGYATLIGHLERTIGCLSSSRATALRKSKLRQLRTQLARFEISHDLVLADRHWGSRPLDLEVGDVALLLSSAALDGECANYRSRPVPHILATAPGTGTIALSGRPSPIELRVSRRGFTGLARYRHLEDPIDD